MKDFSYGKCVWYKKGILFPFVLTYLLDQDKFLGKIWRLRFGNAS